MKNYCCLFLLLFMLGFSTACNKIGQNQELSYHYEKFTSDLNESISRIQFIDTNTAFGISYSGKVFKTLDKGLTWQSSALTDVPLKSIFFADKDFGFVVGGASGCGGTGCIPKGSIIFKTVNGGISWVQQSVPYQWSELNSVVFIDKNIGFAVGKALQLKTTDGGVTWNKFELNSEINKLLFINSHTGIASGLLGNIFKTVDQGNSWFKVNNISDGHIYDFCFPDEEIGYAAGQREIVKTVDGGNNWNILTNSPTEVYFIHFADIENGIAIGKGHYTGGDWGTWTSAIYSTSDGGNTWKMEDNVNFGSIACFPYSKIGYALGTKSIYKITID